MKRRLLDAGRTAASERKDRARFLYPVESRPAQRPGAELAAWNKFNQKNQQTNFVGGGEWVQEGRCFSFRVSSGTMLVKKEVTWNWRSLTSHEIN